MYICDVVKRITTLINQKLIIMQNKKIKELIFEMFVVRATDFRDNVVDYGFFKTLEEAKKAYNQIPLSEYKEAEILQQQKKVEDSDISKIILYLTDNELEEKEEICEYIIDNYELEITDYYFRPIRVYNKMACTNAYYVDENIYIEVENEDEENRKEFTI